MMKFDELTARIQGAWDISPEEAQNIIKNTPEEGRRLLNMLFLCTANNEADRRIGLRVIPVVCRAMEAAGLEISPAAVSVHIRDLYHEDRSLVRNSRVPEACRGELAELIGPANRADAFAKMSHWTCMILDGGGGNK